MQKKVRRQYIRSTALLIRAAAVFAAFSLGACASMAPRNDHLERVELLALLQTLNADLLSHDSATLTLERWCADHRLAAPARVVAQRVRSDVMKPIPDEMRAHLAVDASEPLGYRHVRLACGEHVLSEADNWYVPSRLTAEMNRQLDTSDEPFGKVVKPLGFQRHTLSADLLWSPLSAQWEMRDDDGKVSDTAGPLRIPSRVLRHRAVLYSSSRQPFSAVQETYTSDLFAFGRWRDRLPAGN